MTPNDHDLLISLNQKVDNILERLDGHVPTKCILHEQRLNEIDKRLDSGVQSSRWGWGTAIAVIALITSIVIPILTNLLR